MEPEDLSHSEGHVSQESWPTANSDAPLLECKEDLAFHSSLLNAISDGVLAHTLDGRVVYVNDAACHIYGFCRDELDSLGPWGWVPAHARDLIATRLAAVQRPEGVVFASFGPLRADGSPMHTEVHARVCDTPRHGKVIVSVVHDATDRVLAEERIRHLALHDTLTGLPNRGLLQERMQSALADADRHGDIVGVVFADLDDFKPVNDALGHAAGDEVLKIVAGRLKSCMRESDTVARVGGDEFVALFPRLGSENDLATVASSIAGCIDTPIQINGNQITVTASVGLAVYMEGEATDELLNRADHAMYGAKQDGRSGWEEFLAAQPTFGR